MNVYVITNSTLDITLCCAKAPLERFQGGSTFAT